MRVRSNGPPLVSPGRPAGRRRRPGRVRPGRRRPRPRRPAPSRGVPGGTGVYPGPPAPDLTGVAPLPLTGEHLAAFEVYVAAKLAELRIPGASVAVVQGGEVVFLQGFGVRQLGRPEPVTADTLLRIGSVTKSFSSLLAATLVDADRVSWETPLVALLPGFAVADAGLTPRLTVRDAFCACSGLPRRDFELIFNGHELTPELLVAGTAQIELTAPYGETFQYSNQMVAAGGYAAAVADGGSPTDLGRSYAIALRERVLDPIGMERSTLSLAEAMTGDDYATPHAQDVTGALRPIPQLEDDPWVVVQAPSGALWSSAREMARYVQTELARGVSPDGVRVVSAENLERTWQPGVVFPAASETPPVLAAAQTHYALGWSAGTSGGQRLSQHAGATLGFEARATLLPEADLGVVVLTNGRGTAGWFTWAVTFRLMELVFDQPAAFDAALAPLLAAETQPRTDLLAQLGQIDPAAVTPYLGRYANPALGEATLVLRDGRLIFDAGEIRSELRPRVDAADAVTDYRLVDPPLAGIAPYLPLTFGHDAGGRPRLELVVTAYNLVYPFEPIGATTPPP